MPRRLGRSNPENRMPRDGFRAVGLIERPRGLKGEVKALPLTDFPERLEPGARVFIAGLSRRVARCTWQKGRVYLYLDGISDRESAESLRGELIEIPANERPRTDEPFWYIDEIEGLRVQSREGEQLGSIREVLQTGANDVYLVDRGDQRDLLVPALGDVVVDVDLGRGTMTVDLPDGLLRPDASLD